MGRRTMLVAALAVVVSAAIAAPAGAHTPQPTTARVVGPVVIDKKDPTVAYLKAKYRCTGEGALWISVKQTAARTKDPALTGEGSSAISAAWSMSHRNAVTCDGKAHFGHFVVDQVETSQFGSVVAAQEGLGLGAVLPLRRELPGERRIGHAVHQRRVPPRPLSGRARQAAAETAAA